MRCEIKERPAGSAVADLWTYSKPGRTLVFRVDGNWETASGLPEPGDPFPWDDGYVCPPRSAWLIRRPDKPPPAWAARRSHGTGVVIVYVRKSDQSPVSSGQ